MSHSDARTLISRGRTAGLQTAELYTALTTRPPQRHEANGQADGNGFISSYDDRGHRVYRPGEGQRT